MVKPILAVLRKNEVQLHPSIKKREILKTVSERTVENSGAFTVAACADPILMVKSATVKISNEVEQLHSLP